ncbi:MAG TPA: phosphoribosylamine--glycine ligase, partial [Bacteroidetes bacterium]|nr:phosphoribosylamine--glycine ligase [Bacteroidota bacterium]
MNALVLGSGGREHAIAYKLSLSSSVDRLFWTPGNGATEEIAENPGIDIKDFNRIVSFVKQNNIKLTVVGPEAPLVDGISDRFREEGLNIFGPESKGAMIEGSKIFAKKLMEEVGIPTAQFREFYSYKDARRYIDQISPPYVIKADGLAAGKGVIIAENKESGEKALVDMFKNRIFGDSGTKVVIEQFLKGEEATVLALCDGKNVLPLISSQDHKAVYDGDKGPNTGGMGAIAPAPVVNSRVLGKVID